MKKATVRTLCTLCGLALLGWSGAALAQADHGIGFSRSNDTPVHVGDMYRIRFIITANQDTCGDQLQARDLAVEVRRADSSVAFPQTWGFIQEIKTNGHWELTNGAYWGQADGSPDANGPYIIFPPWTDPANPPRAVGTQDVAGTVRFPIYEVQESDYAVGPTMSDTVTLRWYDECNGQCDDCVSGPYDTPVDGTAALESPSTDVSIIAYVDANANGTYDEGEGVDGVCDDQTVDLHITETNDGDLSLSNVTVTIRRSPAGQDAWVQLGAVWNIGVLGIGQTASLDILDVDVTEDTDFDAIGTGTDTDGYVVTWCAQPSTDPNIICDDDEREITTVVVTEAPPCEIEGPAEVCADEGSVLVCYAGPPVIDYFTWELSGCGETPIVLAEGEFEDCVDVPIPADGDCTLILTLTTEANGCISTCEHQIVVYPMPPCDITGPDSICVGEQAQFCGPAGADFEYLWSIEGTLDATFCGGINNTECVDVCVAPDAVAGEFTLVLTVTDTSTALNCSSTCETLVTIDPCEGSYCSYTQGFWGNAGGKKFGLTTVELIGMAIAAPDPEDPLSVGADPIVVGAPGQSITFDTAQCIIDLLPSGGPAMALPAGEHTCAGEPGMPAELLKKKGRINNTLVGQAVALSLNLRLVDAGVIPPEDYGQLGEFVLPEEFCVDYGDGEPVQYMVPEAFQGLTVQAVLDLINDYLGGIISEDDGWDGSGLTGAAGMINEAFDECGEVAPCPLPLD